LFVLARSIVLGLADIIDCIAINDVIKDTDQYDTLGVVDVTIIDWVTVTDSITDYLQNYVF